MTTHLAINFNIGGAIGNGLSTVATFIPKLVLFVVVMIVGWIIARLLRTLVTKLLTKVGFDRVAERGELNRFLGNNTASSIMGRVVYYAVLLFTLQLALGAFGPNPVSNMINGIVNFLPKAFVAIILVVVAFAIGKIVHDVIAGALGGLPYGNILGRIAQVFIIGMGVIAALNQIQIASSVIEPLWIAALAIIVGVAIVGVGGGLIGPMRERWERMLTRAEGEAGSVQQSVRSRAAQHDVQRTPVARTTEGGRESQMQGPTGTGMPGRPGPTHPEGTNPRGTQG